MAKPVLAMERDAVKAAVRRAAGDEMNCAVLLGKDKAVALFRLDVRKGPKILLGALHADFPDGKNPAFGTARIAPDDEATLLLTLNRVPGGATRRIVNALKGSGIKRVRITGEDGSTDSEPESDEAAHADTGTAPMQAPAVAVGAAPNLAGQQGAQSDGAAGKVPPVPGAQRLEQFGTVWTLTRTRVRTSLSSLEQALEQQYGQTPAGPQVAAAFRARVAPVLAALDDRLDGKLAAAAKAATSADRAQLAAEARQILKEHAAYVAGEPLIADLDGNPFVKLEIGKTVTATLDKLSAVMG